MSFDLATRPATTLLLAATLWMLPGTARSDALECPCWSDGVPHGTPTICYEQPGTAIGDFAYLHTGPDFLQVTNFWCRHNARFQLVTGDQARECATTLACLCDGGAGVEICNGVDDDCDGEIDEGFDADGDGFTTCGGDCNDDDPNVHPAAAEACDGLDNDCDGAADENFANLGAPCGQGGCSGGAFVCHPDGARTWCSKQPSPEICDGRDNNCNILIDEGMLTGIPCGKGACTGGVTACADNGDYICSTDHLASAETSCDDIDNDCDGRVDENFPAKGDVCGSQGLCAGATEVCAGDGEGLACSQSPVAETCNGVDDNCDGFVDNAAAHDDCDDESLCTSDACVAGTCENTTTVSCEASTECKRVGCDPETGACVERVVGVGNPCDDGNGCTPTSFCTAGGTCQGEVDCDDGNACTTDTCHDFGQFGQGCGHLTVTGGGVCLDGVCDPDVGFLLRSACHDDDPNTRDLCTPVGIAEMECRFEQIACSVDADCDDELYCTVDSCQSGMCVYQDRVAAGGCGDLAPCQQGWSCYEGAGCVASINPGVCGTSGSTIDGDYLCSDSFCLPDHPDATFNGCLRQGLCDDGIACTGENTAFHGGAPVDLCFDPGALQGFDANAVECHPTVYNHDFCDDGNQCTVDECAGRGCKHTEAPRGQPCQVIDGGVFGGNAAGICCQGECLLVTSHCPDF